MSVFIWRSSWDISIGPYTQDRKSEPPNQTSNAVLIFHDGKSDLQRRYSKEAR